MCNMQELTRALNKSLRPETPLFVGGIFYHTKGKKRRKVQITGGSYYDDDGRVFNFWYWRPMRADGTLGKEEYGYNNEGAFSVIEKQITRGVLTFF